MKCSTDPFNYTLERTGDLISINWLECLVLADTAATPRVGPTSPRSSVHELGVNRSGTNTPTIWIMIATRSA